MSADSTPNIPERPRQADAVPQRLLQDGFLPAELAAELKFVAEGDRYTITDLKYTPEDLTTNELQLIATKVGNLGVYRLAKLSYEKRQDQSLFNAAVYLRGHKWNPWAHLLARGLMKVRGRINSEAKVPSDGTSTVP